MLTDIRADALNKQFEEYQVYQIDVSAISTFAQSPDYRNTLAIDLPGIASFDLDLFHYQLRADHYVTTLMTEDGVEIIPYDGVIKTFRGNRKGGQFDVRLTIDEDFLYGLIEVKGDVVYIEPLYFYVDGAEADQIVVYRQSKIIESEERQCELLKAPGYIPHVDEDQPAPAGQQRVACREVEIAYANDWLMYDDHSQSTTQVENHNLGVMNNTQTNYSSDFDDEFMFVIVETFISTCNTCDPWTSSTAAGQLLNSFSSWGGGGFSNTHDEGVLWTDRNFNGPTIGIAWISAVCFNNFKYATVQDYSSNAGGLRTLLAHELGHNFGSDHVPGNTTIMAEFLNITNDWSNQAVNWINSYMGTVNCLAPCSTGQGPVASFGSNVEEGCPPLVVTFDDLSTGSPTSWSWTFPGGSPNSSSEPNPTVTYDNPGTFDVILEVSNNNGTDSYVVTDYITVNDVPNADFDFFEDELIVDFSNLSTGADSYFWEFGDGDVSSQTNPTHVYNSDNIYEVILTAFNECGSHSTTIFIEIVSQPYAAFSVEPAVGCEPLVVSFINESTENAEFFLWDLPGGNPSTSTQENPVVIYDDPGIYSATLTVENAAGSNTIILDDVVVVDPLPQSGFSAVVNGLNVQFVNASNNATGYLWTFGDGNSSTQVSPSYTYQSGGTYTAMLVSANSCGTDTTILQIVLDAAPVAGFSASSMTGCAPVDVTYTSTSSGQVDSYIWSFPGGSPSASTAASPTVTYALPGVYSAQLIVTNAIGSDTLEINSVIAVDEPTVSSFTFDVDGANVDFLNISAGADAFVWMIDNQIFVETNPSYTFPADGDYLITLIADGPCGPDTSEAVVHIATLPTAGFTSSPTIGCVPFVVQFNNTSSANATSFQWNFPGGMPETSFDPNPVVQYQVAGTYSVTLTAWSEIGSDEVTMTDLVVVNPQPEAGFQTIQDGLEVEFVNTSEEADSYEWLFGDGNFSVESNPTYTYGTFGEYTVMLIATNACGSDTTVVTLNIALIPVPVFEAQVAVGCIPFVVEFQDMSQNGAEEWEWTFPGGQPSTSTLQNPVVTYAQAGVFDVTLVVTNSAGSQALVREQYIEVGDVPLSGFAVTVESDVAVLENMSVGASTYLWNFGDGEIDTSTNPVHTYAGSGEYTIQLVAFNACGSDTSEVTVVVTTTSTVDPAHERGVMKMFPNPTSGHLTVILEGLVGPDEIRVTDMLGRIIYRETNVAQLGATSTYQLDLNGQPAGVYFVVVRKEGFQRSRKVILH